MGIRAKKKVEEKVGTDDFLPLDGNNVNQVQSIPIKKQAQEKDPIVGEKRKPTILYIGHIPHGFFEDQMRGFLASLGQSNDLGFLGIKSYATCLACILQRSLFLTCSIILGLVSSREEGKCNFETGKAKHYGFIEFESPAVTQIVADCMHNYLLFEHILQVQLVPPEKIHPQLWNGSKRNFKALNCQRIQMKHHNRERTAEEQARLMKATLKKDAKRHKKIEAAGIEYDYPAITDGLPPVPKKIKFADDEE